MDSLVTWKMATDWKAHRKTPELPAQLSMSASESNDVSHLLPQVSPKSSCKKQNNKSLSRKPKEGSWSKKDS